MLVRAAVTVCLFLAVYVPSYAQSADYATVSEESRRGVILTLSLNEEQTKLLDELIDAYTFGALSIIEEFTENAAKVSEREIENTRRSGLIDRLEVKRDRKLIDNRKQLFENLSLVLDENQAQRIESAQLRFCRAPMFEELSGDASGFTADPVRVADELGLFDILSEAEFERFDEAMRGYDDVIATRLDRFLSIRDEFARKVARDGDEGRDEAANEYIDSMIGAIIDLRSLHASRLKQIARSLPAPLDEAWLFTAVRLSHPEVFVASTGERLIGDLLGNARLSPEERERVREIRALFEPRYARAKSKWASEIEEAEGRVTIDQAKRSSFITRNDPRVAAAREQITALDTEVQRQLASALEAENTDLVPPLP